MSGRARTALALTTFLLVVERVILAAGAFGLTRRLALTWAASAGILALWALRGLLRENVVKEARQKLTMLIAEAALEQGADGGFLPGEQAEGAVFEGRIAAEQVITRHLPPLVGEPISALVLLFIVKPAAVPILAGMGAVAASALLLAPLRRLAMVGQRITWRKYMDVARGTLTSIRAAPELIASGNEKAHLARLRASIEDWTETAARVERNAALFQRIPFATIVIVALILLVYTNGLELEEAIRLGVFIPPLAGLMRAIFELTRSGPRIQSLGAALDARIRKNRSATQAAAPRPPPDIPCEIRFEAVSFAYGDIPVLKDVSFVWGPGRVLGIKGPNGSGKSTLLKLMMGLLEPTGGRILVGGMDLREIDLPSWRTRIAYLPQRPYVEETMTVIEAMRLIAPDLTDEAAHRSLRRVNQGGQLNRHLGPAVGQLEMPMATLSVGNRQRVALARALALGRPLMLLDEPDENLDLQTASILGEIVRASSSSNGAAIVTHQETLLVAADTLVSLGQP